MKKEIIQSLTTNFEEHSFTSEEGVEFWFARDLQHLLGYAKWRPKKRNYCLCRK